MSLFVNRDKHANATMREDYVAKEESRIGKFEERKVPVRTLNSIWEENVKWDVHFLKIDVEGFEKSVLSGIDLKKYRPWIICIECVEPGTERDTSYEWERYILESGYRLQGKYDINKFYLAEEYSEMEKFFIPLEQITQQYSIYKMYDRKEFDSYLQAVRQQYEESTSWRITSPIRFLRRLVKDHSSK